MFSKSELIVIIMYGGISYVNSVRYDQKALGRESLKRLITICRGVDCYYIHTLIVK